ncbi:hypothetical protein C2L66_37290 [Paraburkholderia caribensis]|nr:hypothetical protein C2L66_37290 [Paraburkholderia caribensis]
MWRTIISRRDAFCRSSPSGITRAVPQANSRCTAIAPHSRRWRRAARAARRAHARHVHDARGPRSGMARRGRTPRHQRHISPRRGRSVRAARVGVHQRGELRRAGARHLILRDTAVLPRARYQSVSDARRGFEHDVGCTVLPDHAGRQPDGVRSLLDLLAQTVSEAPRRAEVFVDGSIRRCSDIAKAVALGAHGALLGRAPLYGLAAAGRSGATDVLAMLHKECRLACVAWGARNPLISRPPCWPCMAWRCRKQPRRSNLAQ